MATPEGGCGGFVGAGDVVNARGLRWTVNLLLVPSDSAEARVFKVGSSDLTVDFDCDDGRLAFPELRPDRRSFGICIVAFDSPGPSSVELCRVDINCPPRSPVDIDWR